MKHFLLFYTPTEDYLEKRPKFRDAHLEKAWASSERGELLLGGALTDPVDRAVLLFRADDRSVVEDFARGDPYVTGGLVSKWEVREWLTVAGEESVNPIRPNSWQELPRVG